MSTYKAAIASVANSAQWKQAVEIRLDTIEAGNPAIAYVRKADDAEFIVRACNSHDELLEALKHLVGLHGKGLAGSHIGAWQDARRAVAKAEGK